MSLTYSGAEPQPSLAWSFESSNVDSVTGLTPSAQVSPGPAQLQGSAALVTNAPTSNTAVYFPGTVYSYMTLGANTPTNFNTNTSNIFVEAWIYINDSSTHRFYGRYSQNDGGGTQDFSCRVTSTRNFGVTNGTVNVSNATSLSTQTWYHVSFSIETDGTSRVFVNGFGGASGSITYGYNASYFTLLGSGLYGNSNLYIRNLRVVQGGVVPVASFTPGAAPFSYASPGYVANMGTTVFTMLGQFITYNPSGKYNTSLVLNNNPALNGSNVYSVYPVLLNSTNTFSVSFWTKVTTLKPNGLNYAVMVGFRGTPVSNASVTNYFDLFQNANNGSLGFYGQNGDIIPSSYQPFIGSSTTPAVGTWYHMAWVVNSTNFTLYVNGVQTGATPVVGNAFTVTNMYLATTSQYLSGQSFSGELDDLRIYNTALTSTQVQSVYSSQGAPAPSRAMPLPKLAWDFNGTTAPYIGTATGTTTGTVSYNSSGKYGQSVIIRNDNDASFSNSLSYSFTTPVSTATGFTISCWIKFLKLPVGSGVGFNGRMALFTGYPFYFYILNGTFGIYGFYSSYILPGGGNCQNYQTDLTTPSTGVWYHVTYTFGQGTSSVYFNGTLKRTAPYVGDSTMGGITIANNGIPSDQSGSFELDDLRIFDRALTSLQVQSIYNQQGVPGRGAAQVQGLLFYTPFNGTTTDSISSVVPTLTGSVSYDSVNAKYTQSLIVTNTPGANATNYLQYAKTIDIAVTGLTCSFWVRTLTDVSTAQTILSFRGVGQFQGQIRYELSSGKFNFSYWNGKNGGGAASAAAFGVGPTLTSSTWYHLAISIKPNGSISFYVNGVEYAAGQNCGLRDIGPTYSIVNSFFVGTSAINPNYQNAFSGEFDDLRLYKYALEKPAIVSLYNTSGPSNFSPPSVSMSGTPLFTQLSPAATSSAVGAFSLRAVNGTSARAVNVRNGTTSATQDFYADRLGNLLTAPVVGQSLANWLGGATGYVTTWYDQSGKGNHAIQNTAANQPKIDLVNKQIDFKPSAYFDLPNGTVPFGNSNYTMTVRHNTINSTNAGIIGSGTYGIVNGVNALERAGTIYSQYWWGNDMPGGTLTSGNILSAKYDNTIGRTLYLNGNSIANNTNKNRNSTNIQNTIGTDLRGNQSAGSSRPLNGELYYVFLFGSALSDTDRTLVEALPI